MQLEQQEKNLLNIEKFINKICNNFYITEISFRTKKATKQNKVIHNNNQYPLVIKLFSDSNIWTLSWDEQYDSSSYVQGARVKDKNNQYYTLEEFKNYTKQNFPEFFVREFYEDQFNMSSEIIKDYTFSIHKKLESIELNIELNNELKNKIIYEKKIKL